MKKRTRDLLALGAQVMSTRDLLTLSGVATDEAPAAESALGLVGAARDAALRALRSGPRLAAALELGRRAWMLPSPAGRHVRGPVDVAAVCAPRFIGEEPASMALALDRRLTIARLDVVPLDPVRLLHFTLGAGVTRVVLGVNRRGHRAVPTTDDVALAEKLHAACAFVDVALLDLVICGDDGFASLHRLGIVPVPAGDGRYR